MLVSVMYSKLIYDFLLSNTYSQVFKLISIKILFIYLFIFIDAVMQQCFLLSATKYKNITFFITFFMCSL
jgi:hypothetical protein